VIDTEVPFGPTGQVVYDRTYSRTLPDGSKETWPETVRRVAHGNLALVYGKDDDAWPQGVKDEYNELVEMMDRFAILPAGRHLWASGVRGRQYLFNCHVSGWGMSLSDHFEFTFMRLMEGGGVGANYSTPYLSPFGGPRRKLKVHVVCDPAHPDYAEMKAAGVLSDEYHHEWEGAFPVEDSREGWAAALVDLIDTFMSDQPVLHENRVYDVSRVRAKGQPLRTFGGTASGPQPFARMMLETGKVMNWANPFALSPLEAMEIDHAIAECVVSGGVRRSARMAICRWDDPFIFDFIKAKQDTGLHWTTNISVEIDQQFLDELGKDGYEHAQRVHDAVVNGMLTNGEPGYWNSTLSNVGEVGGVIATNPCGEIALPEWGACVLGHVNLDAFAPKEKGGAADLEGMALAHALVTRFLIRATYGDMNDPKQKHIMDLERRIGVGHLGVQGFLAKLGIKYSEAPDSYIFRGVLDSAKGLVRDVARQYAFDLRIPEPVKVTTVAPTGSIAKLPGVTEGIHPIYARHFLRRIRFNVTDVAQADTVLTAASQGFHVETDIYDQSGNTMVVTYPTKDKLVDEVVALGFDADLVESADEIPLDKMLAFQAMYQHHYADNAVSFTANVPEGLDPTEVAATIAQYLPVLKGTTVMVDGTRPQAPYERITEEQFLSYEATRIEDGTDEDCATGACPVR
jgi:adenosylcobalamin-dependent ribonucleoside-triphosphate reductase